MLFITTSVSTADVRNISSSIKRTYSVEMFERAVRRVSDQDLSGPTSSCLIPDRKNLFELDTSIMGKGQSGQNLKKRLKNGFHKSEYLSQERIIIENFSLISISQISSYAMAFHMMES
jgi:hypothetical protein